jgi:hypothetical protein
VAGAGARRSREELFAPTSSRPTSTPDDLLEGKLALAAPRADQTWSERSVPIRTGFVPEGVGIRAAFLLLHVDGQLNVGEIAAYTQLDVDEILPHFIGLGMLGAIEVARTASVSGIELKSPRAPARLDESKSKLVHLLPEADEPLPTLPGVTETPWFQHTSLLLRDGRILDPRSNAIHSDVDAWKQAIVGDAPDVRVMINGRLVR